MAVLAGRLRRVEEHWPRVPHPYGEADAEAFVALRERRTRPLRFVIQRKEDGLFLGGDRPASGRKALNSAIGWASRSGAWAMPPRRRARLVLFAFEESGPGHVHAGWFHDNPASGHVLAKLGARHNGSRMRDCRARGRKVLCHEMLLTRADFLRKQAA